MSKEEQLQKKVQQRISIQIGEGILTEIDMAELLGIPVATVIRLIDEGQLPGRRIGHNFKRARTLTSIKQLIKYCEKGADKA